MTDRQERTPAPEEPAPDKPSASVDGAPGSERPLSHVAENAIRGAQAEGRKAEAARQARRQRLLDMPTGQFKAIIGAADDAERPELEDIEAERAERKLTPEQRIQAREARQKRNRLLRDFRRKLR